MQWLYTLCCAPFRFLYDGAGGYQQVPPCACTVRQREIDVHVRLGRVGQLEKDVDRREKTAACRDQTVAHREEAVDKRLSHIQRQEQELERRQRIIDESEARHIAVLCEEMARDGIMDEAMIRDGTYRQVL
jgi:hypothetical protein